MSGAEATLPSLQAAVLREAGSAAVQELPPGFYQSLSSLLGRLSAEEYEGAEAGLKEALLASASDAAGLLFGLRLAKAASGAARANLLDEEKFVLDSHDEASRRRELVLGGVLRGRARMLESVAQAHKARPVLVRFLRDVDELLGADMASYGPFRAQDLATVPYDNAEALVAAGAAAAVSPEGGW